MKNKKRLALYDPYLDTLGGGEKHILSILKVLGEESYEINIYWDKNLTRAIKQKFSLLTKKFTPNIFKTKLTTWQKFNELKRFDIFFYVTDGSYFFSGAKRNFIFCMVPQKNLYRMNLLNKLKTANYRFISNSKYTHDWLQKWGIKNDYIYPYIEDVFLEGAKINKEKIILSVGRFFSHLHTKHHKDLIKAFKKIKQSKTMQDFRLILVGGLKKEDQNYFAELKDLARTDSSIILKPNVNFTELVKLYHQATFYWHFAGLGIDEANHPEMVEHLGITPLEAMASGCITFCYQAGGPKEIINDGKNGYLFSDADELIKKNLAIVDNSELQKKITNNAGEFIKNNFSYSIFKQKVKKIIL